MVNRSEDIDVVAKARRATVRRTGWLKAVGRGETFGVPATYTLVAGDDAFAVHTAGALTLAWGHEGEHGWFQDSSGIVRAAEAPELAMARMIGSVIADRWAELNAPATIERAESGDGPEEVLFTLDPGDDAPEATLVVDAESAQPIALVCQRPFGIERWQFGDFESGIPRRIDQILPGGVTNSIHLEQLSSGLADAAEWCTTPASRTEGWAWDDNANPELSVERTTSGFVLIDPIVNGHKPGPFVFDTGAAVSVIARSAAEACGLDQLGHSWSSYATGSIAAPRWKGRHVELGPLRYENPWFTEMDMSLLSRVTGRAVAGVLGWDVLARAIVDLQLAVPRVALYDPRLGRDVNWQPLSLYSNRPHVRAQFATSADGSGEGLFRLDSGAPRVGVIFNAPAVARYALAGLPGMAPLKLPLPGGTVDATMGPYPWIDLAGRRFRDVRGLCVIGSGTGFDDAACAGNLGQEVLGGVRFIFDYAHRRAAMEPIS